MKIFSASLEILSEAVLFNGSFIIIIKKFMASLPVYRANKSLVIEATSQVPS